VIGLEDRDSGFIPEFSGEEYFDGRALLIAD
jgi:hypothetical protein